VPVNYPFEGFRDAGEAAARGGLASPRPCGPHPPLRELDAFTFVRDRHRLRRCGAFRRPLERGPRARALRRNRTRAVLAGHGGALGEHGVARDGG